MGFSSWAPNCFRRFCNLRATALNFSYELSPRPNTVKLNDRLW